MDVCGPMEAFAMANALTGRGLYRLSVTAITTDPITTSLGFSIVPNTALADLDGPIDTLLVAGGYGHVTALRDPALTGWLREAAPRARRHGSICTGAFLLAASGLSARPRTGRLRRLSRSFQIEDTDLPAQTVAKRCGFGTVHSLRRAFVRQLGVTPQWYRAQFQKNEAARDVI